jgi:hypothetical protein
MAHTMLWAESVSQLHPGPPRDPGDLLDSLVRFATAGMSSPVPVTAGVRAESKGGRT